MKKIILPLLLLLGVMNIYAQEINKQVLNELQKSFKLSTPEKAIQTALSNNSIKKLAYNRQQASKQDHLFDIEVKTGSITDQKSSGRCWMFTSLNVFRPDVIDHFFLSDFEFSENYLYFYDILEKSNVFLERIIATRDRDIYDREVYSLLDNPVGDGGAWATFVNLVKKYGAVPKEVMPETEQSQSTSSMIRLLNELLRKDAMILRDDKNASIEDLRKQKVEMLKDVYKILALSLGEPPTEFQWRYKYQDGAISEYKTYTPQSFWEEAVGVNLDDYVMFIDDPTRPYYKLYTRQNDKNVYEGIDWTYINVPGKDLKPFIIESLSSNEILYFSCDVGKFLSKDEGTLDLNNYDFNSLYGVDFTMTRAQRMLTHQSGSTHGMALCGVDLDENGNPTKWKLENSWGGSYGHNGYLTMTDEWFDEYFFRLVINKKYLPKKILDILKQKPIEVPFYNPAFSDDL